jgi:hypothetical protein
MRFMWTKLPLKKDLTLDLVLLFIMKPPLLELIGCLLLPKEAGHLDLETPLLELFYFLVDF